MMPASPTSSRTGFTTVELLIVLVMIGLVTAIAVPRINYARFQVDGGMRAVAGVLMASQREAVARQHDVVVGFDAPAGLLRIVYDANNNRMPDGGERVRTVALDDHVVIGRGAAAARPFGPGPVSFVRVVDGLPAVTFHRNGSASEAGGVYLTSARAAAGGARFAAEARAIEITRATGRPDWFRFDGTAWKRGF